MSNPNPNNNTEEVDLFDGVSDEEISGLARNYFKESVETAHCYKN